MNSTPIKWGLVITASSFLLACSPTEPIPYGSYDDSSNNGELYYEDTLNVHCNTVEGPNVLGSIGTYQLNGDYFDNRFRLHFENLPAEIFSPSADVIQFWGWKMSPTGAESINSFPYKLTFQNLMTAALSTRTFTALDYHAIITIIEDEMQGRSFDLASELESFFDEHQLILLNVGAQDQAIIMGHYSGDIVLQSFSFLIPGFAADPNIYMDLHTVDNQKSPNNPLTGLHPRINQRDQGWTDEDFLYSIEDEYCRNF